MNLPGVLEFSIDQSLLAICVRADNTYQLSKVWFDLWIDKGLVGSNVASIPTNAGNNDTFQYGRIDSWCTDLKEANMITMV